MSAFPLLPRRRSGSRGVVLTPAKVNLFLEIEGRRSDGYHALTTLLAALDFRDVVSVEGSSEPRDRLRVDGLAAREVPDGPENLVHRALARLRQETPIPWLSIRLRKRIPPGRGLGGGSGNAAGILALVRDLHAPDFPPRRLISLAGELGTDVPFFFSRGFAVGRGRGDELTEIEERPLGGDRPVFLLVLPIEPSSTAAAYRRITFPLTSPDGPISFRQKTFVTSRDWIAGLFNRFTRPVATEIEGLQPLVEWLDRRVPDRWLMCGSGSAFFVVCQDAREARQLAAELRRGSEPGLASASTRIANALW